jgi:hypothetical protein
MVANCETLRAFHILTEAYPAVAKKLLHSLGGMVASKLPM